MKKLLVIFAFTILCAGCESSRFDRMMDVQPATTKICPNCGYSCTDCTWPYCPKCGTLMGVL